MFPSWNPHNTSRIFPWSSSKWRVAMMLASKVLVFALSGDTSNSIWVYWVYHTDLGKLSPTWNKAHNGPPSFQRGYSEVVISYPDLGILDYWVYHSVSYRYVWKHLERSKKKWKNLKSWAYMMVARSEFAGPYYTGYMIEPVRMESVWWQYMDVKQH